MEGIGPISSTPPKPLNGITKGTFVFKTITERWPTIISKIVELFKQKLTEEETLRDSDVRKDIDFVINELSLLIERISTNKPLELIHDKLDDADVWNAELERLSSSNASTTWFEVDWILAECYLYRKINGILSQTVRFKGFDPFEKQKQQSFYDGLAEMAEVGLFIENACASVPWKNSNTAMLLDLLLKISLWGNTCDLSLSLGEKVSLKDSIINMAKLRSEKILCDQSAFGRRAMMRAAGKRVDIILDNAGMELFTDLILADFLITKVKIGKVVFRGKKIPWFVSDTTKRDLDWFLKQLSSQKKDILVRLGDRWQKFFTEKKFEFNDNSFWTSSFTYDKMRAKSPDLYKDLCDSTLIILKGDLNYRKLVGDLKWKYSTVMEDVVRGFTPAPILVLRTLKSETVAGLDQKTVDFIKEKFANDEKWMTTGEYGVVQHILPAMSF